MIAVTAEAITYQAISAGGATVTRADHPASYLLTIVIIFIIDVILVLQLLNGLCTV